MFGPLLEVEMSKKCTPLWREAHFEVKTYKAHQRWTTFGSWDVEKVHAVVARSTVPSQNAQRTPASDHFWRFMWFCVAGARDSAPCQKWAKPWGFCRISEKDGRRGTFAEDLQRCISPGRRNTRDMFTRDVRRSEEISWEGLHFGASDRQVC